MELAVLWLVLVIIGKAFSAAEQQKKKQRQTQKKKTSVSTKQRESAKPKGFFETLSEELKKIEQEQMRKEPVKKPREPARRSPQPKRPSVSPVSETDVCTQALALEDEEVRAEKYEQEQRRRHEKLLSEPRQRVDDTNYQVYRNQGFSVQNLQQRYTNPAQQMMVFSEILGKPVSMRHFSQTRR